MKILSYMLGIIIVVSGIDILFTTVSACPRCRRALPKGPRKHPHPGFPKKSTEQNSSLNNTNQNNQKNSTTENLNEAQ